MRQQITDGSNFLTIIERSHSCQKGKLTDHPGSIWSARDKYVGEACTFFHFSTGVPAKISR